LAALLIVSSKNANRSPFYQRNITSRQTFSLA
jgi:hypothetical protein